MVWFKKKPTANERLAQAFDDIAQAQRNKLAQISNAETEEYAGEIIPIQQEQKMETQVPTRTTTIENLPNLVSKSIDMLTEKRNQTEKELQELKARYDLQRAEMMAQLKLVNVSIRAWEAAQTVYNNAALAEAVESPETEKPKTKRRYNRTNHLKPLAGGRN